MNKFYKISKNLYINDFKKYYGNINDDIISKYYDDIVIPKRATKGSAGYDFYSPISFSLEPKNTILLLTGIRIKMEFNQVLLIFPRSSLGFKYNLKLDNTIGVIDSDYYDSDNEGHILVKMTNDSQNKTLIINKGDAFCQGILLRYDLTSDDNVENIRNGGIGSTNEK